MIGDRAEHRNNEANMARQFITLIDAYKLGLHCLCCRFQTASEWGGQLLTTAINSSQRLTQTLASSFYGNCYDGYHSDLQLFLRGEGGREGGRESLVLKGRENERTGKWEVTGWVSGVGCVCLCLLTHVCVCVCVCVCHSHRG